MSSCTPAIPLCIPPPDCDMVCLHNLVAGAPSDNSFLPFYWHPASPRWLEDLGIAPFRPTIPPQVHIPEITHPTLYKFFAMVPWCLMHPPFILSEPALRTEHLPHPPHGVMGNPDPAPDRVGLSQPPVNFVDVYAYIVLRGLMEARDCKLGLNKVIKASDSGDEKVVAQNLELLSNAGRSEDQARDRDLPRVGKAKTPWARGSGGLSS